MADSLGCPLFSVYIKKNGAASDSPEFIGLFKR